MNFTPERQWYAPRRPPYWTCTDYVMHEHRWWLTAWLCAKWQEWTR